MLWLELIEFVSVCVTVISGLTYEYTCVDSLSEDDYYYINTG